MSSFLGVAGTSPTLQVGEGFSKKMNPYRTTDIDFFGSKKDKSFMTSFNKMQEKTSGARVPDPINDTRLKHFIYADEVLYPLKKSFLLD
jgi:hypothetical protein